MSELLHPGISHRTRLALGALHVLAGDPWRGTHCPGSRLASAVGTSPAFLSHVLAPLVRVGWVESTSGPGGGYRVTADLTAVSLLELVERIEGPIEASRCVLSQRPCTEDAECALHRDWALARASLIRLLRATPVAEANHRPAHVPPSSFPGGHPAEPSD